MKRFPTNTVRRREKGITPDLFRRLYSGDEVVPIQVWRQVGAGLGKLGVSKLDTNGG